MSVQLGIENPGQPDVRLLLGQSDAYMATLYPAESNHMLDVGELQRPAVSFFVARRNGIAVGCGALLRQADDWSEIKRMFVSPAARGQSIARRLLAALEAEAARLGAHLLRLETGTRQPEALALYRSAGYAERGPFGSYPADPLSVFMEKSLRR